MLKVEYFSDLPAFSFVGHAQFAPFGGDVICSGASTLLFTLIECLEKLEDDFDVEICETDERLNISLDPPISLRHDAKLLFEIFATGFEMLSKDFPDYVRFIKDPPKEAGS